MIRAAFTLSLAALPAAAEVRFQDMAAALPVAHEYAGGWEHFVGGGVAALDCNADGFPDLFAAGGTAPARLFVNATRPGGALAFTLGAVPELTGVTGAYPLDIDGDGWLDLAVLRVGPNLLLRGGPDCAFEDATAAWGFDPGDRWSTAFAATWEAGQDRPTLAVGNYVDRTNPKGPFMACDVNELHRPAGAAYAAPLTLEPGFCALSLLVSDWARDGNRDLRVSNDRHYYVRGGTEQMWRLDPAPRLLGPEDGFDRLSIWGMGIASRDLTGDAVPEVFLTSMGDQILHIATGEPGYRPAPYGIGTYAHAPFTGDDGRPSTGWHAEFADVDNDGRPDLFIAKGNVDQMPTNAMKDPNNLLRQKPDGTFEEVALTAGVASGARSRGAALADLDRDGRVDLVVVNRRAPMEVYRNVTEGAGGWVAVQPRQPGPNGFAVGAWVELRRGRTPWQTRESTVGGGHAGGAAGPLHFGLGTETGAELRVIWPGGTASAWVPVPTGQAVEAWPAPGGGLELRPIP
jgi:hypothetical protein